MIAQTGELQWRWNTEPAKGEPGFETWPDEEARAHGGGMTWMTGTYDPELQLIYWGIGNPNPVHAGAGRKGDNVWTCSIVALHVDTGKMAWGYQVSPHDTHDWDATQTPILFNGEFKGKQRKLIAQASRNGYFFLLDRTNGEHLLTAPFIKTNWTLGINAKGQPIPNPEKEPTRNGTLVSPSSNGASNWFAPSFNPQAGLFYVVASQSYSVFYLTAEGKAEGFAGRDDFLNYPGTIEAIDYKTGAISVEARHWRLGAGIADDRRRIAIHRRYLGPLHGDRFDDRERRSGTPQPAPTRITARLRLKWTASSMLSSARAIRSMRSPWRRRRADRAAQNNFANASALLRVEGLGDLVKLGADFGPLLIDDRP